SSSSLPLLHSHPDLHSFPTRRSSDLKMVSNSVKGAQAQVENQNFEMRKNVLKYDEVLNEQRKVVYATRREILEASDIKDNIRSMIADTVTDYVAAATATG